LSAFDGHAVARLDDGFEQLRGEIGWTDFSASAERGSARETGGAICSAS
jgi:hypothetical protein